MNLSLTLLALLSVFVLALLALSLIFSRLPVLAKVLLLIITAGAYIFAYQGWKEAQGWPATTSLPEQFLLHASVIEEPDPETGTAGRIFLWASTLQDAYPADQPRAYELPYGKELHSRLAEALRQQRNGKVQLGSLQDDQGRMINKNTDITADKRNTMIKFSDLPDPALPEK